MSSADWRTPFVILLCGTAVMLIAFGVRMTYGLWIAPASTGLGWGLESLSFAQAAQALVWGFAAPVMGVIADRHGTGRVIAACGIAFALGFIVTANATTRIEAFIGIGVLTGIAMGGLTASVILSAISKVVEDERKRGLYAGIASAGGSSGQVVLVPVVQFVLDATDWMTALLVLAAVTAAIVPLAYTMVSRREHLAAASGQQSLSEALGEAFRHRGYLLLAAGYFVCGFQTLFMVTHLPPMLETYDVSPEMGAWSIALIGLFNILGCVIFGAAGGRWRKKNLLAWIYIARAVAMTAFILLPVTDTSIAVFSAVMGILWLGVVPLTGGVVAQIFGTRYMATLFGCAFVSHQLGGFVGIWAGGWLFDMTGNYLVVWWASIVLGVVAAAFNLPIDDRPVERLAEQRS